MSAAEMEALAAVDALIEDYARHRRDDYFAHFDPAATFVFHTSAARLESRAEYEELWRSWETEDDFHVIACESSNRRLQLFDDIAVFSHDVHTTMSLGGRTDEASERETIVLRRGADGWTCVHEHLSGRD